MKLSEYAKKNNLTYQSALRHWKNGLLNGKQLATGTIVIFEDDSEAVKNKIVQVATYARVSSSQNKDDLDKQQDRLIDYANAKGYKTIYNIKEIGSGLNDSRPQLIKLLRCSLIDIILVEHKDRLTRFGFKYIEELLDIQGRKIEVINNIPDDKDDLIQDFISVITSFCARIYGQRRCKRKTEKLIKELNVKGN
jgi:predicted site-specific integrase-resolvase